MNHIVMTEYKFNINKYSIILKNVLGVKNNKYIKNKILLQIKL